MPKITLQKIESFKLLFFIVLFLITSQIKAQFPFYESFKNSTAPGIEYGGSPSKAFLTGGAGNKDGFTDQVGSGYLRLTNSLGNQTGLIWSDLYAFPSGYEMTVSFEYYTHSGNGADGIAFILFDAAVSTVKPGAYGGSLGYAQAPGVNGFSGGYLGIGIDEYGGFGESSGGKNGGLSSRLTNNISLRGSESTGYKYLTSAVTGSFQVAGNDRAATDETNNNFRKVEINMKPRPVGSPGVILNVYLTHGSIKSLIIKDYIYTETPPSNLKFAISSSTGAQNNFHEIRNLNLAVDLSFLKEPIANPDSFSGCAGQVAISDDITANDNGTVNILGTINKESIDLDPAPDKPGIQTSKTVNGKGTFTYDSTTGKVTFTPINNTIEGPVVINYIFNDSYGKTSNASTITYNTIARSVNIVATGVSICKGSTGSLTASESVPVPTTTFSGHWNSATDPKAKTIYTELNNSTSCKFSNSTTNYTATKFSVTLSGTYVLKMTDTDAYDGAAYIYSGDFIPGNCLGGGKWIIGDDDIDGLAAEPRLIANLEAGVEYTLISTLWTNSGQLFIEDYTWTITPPSGGQFLLSALNYWYTSLTGGDPIGWGNTFNPVDVADSGLPDTNTPGKTTYYIDNGTPCSTRTPVTFTIKKDNTASAASSQPRVCINSALTTITHTTTDATGIGTAINLPTGVTASWNSNTITISGTPTVSGVFDYTIPLTGGCGNVIATGTITVIAKPSDVITTASICSGQTYRWLANNQDYTTSQTGTTIINNGCTADQVLNLTVTPKPADVVTSATICSGQTYTWAANNTAYTTSQSGLRINNNGCAADQILNLTVTPKPEDIVTTQNICSGQTYTWTANSTVYNTSQTGLRISNNGCTADQILNLTVTPKPEDNVTTAEIFSGDTYRWTANDRDYTTSQTKTTIINDGCTANQVLNLTVLERPAGIIATGVSICKGESGSLTTSASAPLAVTSFSGHWNSNTDPRAFVPYSVSGNPMKNSPICRFSTTGSGNYTATTFTVTVSGIYNFKMSNPLRYDGMAYIYSGDFTPGTCSGGGTWIIGDDDYDGGATPPRLITHLDAGVKYTLISTIWTTTSSNFVGDYTWTIIPPAGGQFLLDTLNYWYTSSTGGNPIGWGNSFNPVGVPGSGLTNTNTSGTTTYYVTDGIALTRTPVTFTINENNTVSTATSISEVCINSALAEITHTTTGATGIGAPTGLPSGVTASWLSNTITISGTPTVSGVFDYSIPLTGGCGNAVATGTIKVTAKPVVLATVSNILCKAKAEGSINLTVTEGIAPYTYSWSGTGVISNVKNQINLAAGTYQVTVTDSKGCSSSEISITLTEPTIALSATSNNKIDIKCKGETTGSVVITPSGGTAPYNITPAQSELAAGLHTFTVTDANNCSTTVDVTINEPDALSAMASNQINAKCKGDDNGSVTITPSGGIAPYDITPAQSGLVAGLYTFNVTDANNCTTTVDVTINEPNKLTALSSNQVNVLRKGDATGSVTITPSGGTSPYEISPAQSELTAGLHTFTVTDANHCTTTVDVIISEPEMVLSAIASNQIDVKCKGESTGSVLITASGGSGGYTITPIQTDLKAGIHTFTITDSNNITTTVDVTINEPNALSAVASNQIDAKCKGDNNGSVTITPSGGTAPYNITPAQSGLTAGVHTFTITDANNCTTTVDVTISEPDALSAVASNLVDVKCKGDDNGSVTITPSGGTAPYNITPAQNNLTAGLHTFTITDANNCSTTVDVTINEPDVLSAAASNLVDVKCKGDYNGSVTITPSGGTAPYDITPAQSGLTAGVHTFTVTDSNACTTTVDVTINEPDVLNAKTTEIIIPEFCSGDKNGAFSLDISGGSKPYSYSLNKQNGTFIEGTSDQSLFEFTDLTGGKYIVYIKDAMGCSTQFEVVIPAGIVINPVAEVTYSCMNNTSENSVIISVDSSNTNSADLDYSLDGAAFQPDNIFVNLAPGNHIVTVRHTNGCEQSTSSFVVDQIDLLSLTLADGELNEIVATTTGGIKGYQYTFEGESYNSANKFIIYKSGTYTVTVTDKKGCTATVSKYFEYIDVCIPNYFTPNGDGVSDEWGPDCTINYKNLTYTIFDRYGRIIAKYKYGQKWDGKYNGAELTSGDYWYILKLNDPKDNREFVGHFTLYR